MENTPFQKKLDNTTYKGLNTFLSDMVCLGGTRTNYKPKFAGKDLTTTLAQLSEQIEVGKEIYIAPNQRYFMGAGDEPELTIISKVDDDNIYYYQAPWKDEQMVDLQTGADLLSIGCEKWLKTHSGGTSELYKSIQSVANGKPGVEVSVEELQPVNIQISYTGDKKGDRDPWVHLETEYGLTVNSVLNNKQIYNVRLNRKELKEVEDRLSQEAPGEKVFSISKIMMEDRRLFVEETTNVRLLAPGWEEDSYRAMVDESIGDRHSAEGFVAGEKVIFKGEEWMIGMFSSDGKSIRLFLVKDDFTKVAEFVPIDRVEKVDLHVDTISNDIDDDKRKKELDDKIEQTKEVFIVGVDNKVCPKFPVDEEGNQVSSLSDEDCKKLSIKMNSASLETKVITEEVDHRLLLKSLMENIKNDDVLARRKESITQNMIRKMEKNMFDINESTNGFMYVIEEAARKIFKSRRGEIGGDEFSTWQEMFPVEVRERIARRYSKTFKANYEAGAFNEDVQTFILDLSKKKLMKEGKEELEYTSKEIDEIESHSGFEIEAANLASVSWDDLTKRYKTEVYKMNNPKGSGYVYYSTTKRNDVVDPKRSIYSDSFEAEYDTTILKNFLSDLNLAKSKKR